MIMFFINCTLNRPGSWVHLSGQGRPGLTYETEKTSASIRAGVVGRVRQCFNSTQSY